MDDLIKERCEEFGISPSILTPSEIERLKREIEAEQRGDVVLDGVFSDPDILLRFE